MDLNSNFVRRYLLIPMVLLALQLLYPVTSNSELDKQRRLFNNKFGSNWALEAPTQDENPADDYESKTTGLRFLAELFKSRQRPPISNTEYDQYLAEGSHYENDREIESSIPYGVQNVYDTSAGRLTRSKNHHKSTFQSLCPIKRETILLNMDIDFEYRPDYYEEVRCANAVMHSENKIQAAVCSEAGFSCIQLNGTIFLTRRARGANCWESETRTVAAGCECMWPKHQLGDIAHH
ncbi:uncharacterized protein LOC116343717 [Contarinia nasturtii]|uniref:uncharacterized protein LOC116343717 n=1 Tax=Contarinia nasturtii TaxID=265458 RepID=UPI0012D4ABE4|nr:uncharacterized protein LOC116343717 [Contarinia nasturtii]